MNQHYDDCLNQRFVYYQDMEKKMMTAAERIDFLLGAEGINQKKLAEIVSASDQTVTNWKKRDSIGKDSAQLISKKFGYSLEWLLTGKGEPKGRSDTPPAAVSMAKEPGVYRVDVLDVQASAGDGYLVSTEFVETIRAIEYTDDQANMMFGARPASTIKVITVRGDSMEGTINPGDQIFLDMSIAHFDGDGVYVFIFGKTLHVKRLQMQKNKLAVLSDNQRYQPWYIEEEDEDQFHIMAKVLLKQSMEIKRFA